MKEEPLRGFTHGGPGTGKSRLISWIVRMFKEALGWEHRVEFLRVAFQNRVAHAMGGTTLHEGGNVPVGGAYKALQHLDMDVLFTRNQNLRWVLIDEIGMVSDTLLGEFEHALTDASRQTRFSKRADKTLRPFGGYNVLTFGDLYQIPPIPASGALFIPSKQGKTQHERNALNLFWHDNPAQAFNVFWELQVQKRAPDDLWYVSVLNECRRGLLSDESYNFLLGLPTLHAGSWPYFKEAGCKNLRCQSIHEELIEKIRVGRSWVDCVAMECEKCKEERERRNRLIAPGDERVTREPFIDAPYIHKNNEPKYHALLLRAAEHAKKSRVM